MDLGLFLLLLFLVALAAGFVGSLTGLGGGVIIIPVLVIFFHVPFVVAVGAGFVTILANSAASGSAYVHDRLTDLRIGMFLEIATVPGALLGASITIFLVRANLQEALLVALGVALILLSVGGYLRRPTDPSAGSRPDARSRRLGFSGEYYDRRTKRAIAYRAEDTNSALGMMFGAGVVSGLFGIGSGALKVLALDGALHLPFKVSTATSNFMIGVTACAGAGLLLMAGYVNPVIAAPVAIGATVGALAGSRLLPGLDNRLARLLFVVVVVALSAELIVQGLGGP